jgi:hypothetical protein
MTRICLPKLTSLWEVDKYSSVPSPSQIIRSFL